MLKMIDDQSTRKKLAQITDKIKKRRNYIGKEKSEYIFS